MAQRSALLLANSRYNDPRLAPLRAPLHDARELARVLRDPEIGGFDVNLVFNKSTSVTRLQLDQFFAKRAHDDLLLVLVSCHGLRDERGRLFFATTDTDRDWLSATAIDAEFLVRAMNDGGSRRVILLLDCCYSGAISRALGISRGDDKVALSHYFDGSGRIVISASTALQEAYERAESVGNSHRSLFTKALVEGLETGDADLDHDGYVSVHEMFTYVSRRLSHETPAQTPVISVMSADGTMHIARNPHAEPGRPAKDYATVAVARKRWDRTRSTQRTTTRREMKTGTFSFGRIQTSWLVLDGTGETAYAREDLLCRTRQRNYQLPAELVPIHKAIVQREEENRRAGRQYLWNGENYALDTFVLRRVGRDENPGLDLWFTHCDYYTFLATSMSLDEILPDGQTVRERFLNNPNWYQPSASLSTSFGIDLAVVTKRDQQLVLTQRSLHLGSRPGEYNISANEGLSRTLDHDVRGHPDVFKCAQRGVCEELGFEPRSDDVLFLSLGVDTHLAQWGLLGVIIVEKSAEDIEEHRRSGVKDKWEISQLHYVPFDPMSVAKFVKSNGPWAPGALTCVYHALVYQYGEQSVLYAIRCVAG